MVATSDFHLIGDGTGRLEVWRPMDTYPRLGCFSTKHGPQSGIRSSFPGCECRKIAFPRRFVEPLAAAEPTGIGSAPDSVCLIALSGDMQAIKTPCGERNNSAAEKFTAHTPHRICELEAAGPLGAQGLFTVACEDCRRFKSQLSRTLSALLVFKSPGRLQEGFADCPEYKPSQVP